MEMHTNPALTINKETGILHDHINNTETLDKNTKEHLDDTDNKLSFQTEKNGRIVSPFLKRCHQIKKASTEECK